MGFFAYIVMFVCVLHLLKVSIKSYYSKKSYAHFCRKKRVSAKISVTRRRVQIGAQMKNCAKMSQKRAIMSTNIVVLDQET